MLLLKGMKLYVCIWRDLFTCTHVYAHNFVALRVKWMRVCTWMRMRKANANRKMCFDLVLFLVFFFLFPFPFSFLFVFPFGLLLYLISVAASVHNVSPSWRIARLCLFILRNLTRKKEWIKERKEKFYAFCLLLVCLFTYLCGLPRNFNNLIKFYHPLWCHARSPALIVI